MRLFNRREAIFLTAMGSLGLLTGCPTRSTPNQEAQQVVQGIRKLHTLEEAKVGLDAVMASERPSIYIVSADWCTYCKELESDIEAVRNDSRDVVISMYGDQTSAVTGYATEQYGIPFPDNAIPAVIITQFEGQTVHTEGYSQAMQGFKGTSLGRPIKLSELF